MNADQLKEKWTQFQDELKGRWDRFTDEDLEQIEGNYDKFLRKARERYGDRTDDLLTWADQWHETFQHGPMGPKTP
jgi:uncharacterized protein YjbJ (UPF0337 family)